jgi:hypothetical protein
MRGAPRARWGLVVCALVAVLALVPLAGARAEMHADGHADTHFVLHAAYPHTKILGPGRALGAVIWNHGKPPFRGADGDMLPFYLDRLRDAGWDVFRLDRDWASDNLVLSPAALRDQVRALHTRGYRDVVLAGQSYGAWIALMVAAWGPPVHAVIATAPAAYGRSPESPVYRDNANALYPILDRIHDTRVMLFLFQGDAYDTGDRAAPAREILADHGVAHAVVAYPPGWIGHGAANWNGFATRFAPCILHFIDPRQAAGENRCDRDPVTRASLAMKLPDTMPRVRPASTAVSSAVSTPVSSPAAGTVSIESAGGPADGATDGLMGGLWYGVYANGREALLSLSTVADGTVSAVYAWGVQQRDEADAPGYERRVGRIEGDRVLFAEPKHPTLDVRVLGPEHLSLTWTSSDGTRSDTAELHPLR